MLKHGVVIVDGRRAMSLRRVPLLTVLAVFALIGAGGSVSSARAAAPLTGTRLHDELGQLAAQLGVDPVKAPFSGVSVTTFDALMVRQVGAADVAAAVQHEAWRAGLDPPPAFGTEAVARLLGLRDNLPYRQDARELYPTDAITLAEAEALVRRGGPVAGRRRRVGPCSSSPPSSCRSTHRRRGACCASAVSKVGMPYVWGGETDGRSACTSAARSTAAMTAAASRGASSSCRGFRGARTIRGRTAAAQAGEIPRTARVRARRRPRWRPGVLRRRALLDEGDGAPDRPRGHCPEPRLDGPRVPPRACTSRRCASIRGARSASAGRDGCFARPPAPPAARRWWS